METRQRRPGTTQASQNRRRAAQDVVYTQPAPFNRQRFFLRLMTVVAVVLALIFGMSIFFKVDKQEVRFSFKMQRGEKLEAGIHNYSEQQILDASGIQDGESLITLRESEISGRILDKLPYVVSVRVTKKLPDTVNIEIVETDVVYGAEAADGSWWLIRSDGKITEKTNAADAQQNTVLLGIKLVDPKVGQQAVALEPEAPAQDETGEEKPATVLASEQLSTLLTILKNLESNGVIGQAASVDVTNLKSIEIWYSDRYQVSLGDETRLDYKISAMTGAIDQMKDYESGMLDVSFTIMEDDVIYTPFE